MAPDGKLIVDGGMNILGDLSVDGNFNVKGAITGKELNIEKINVAIPQPDPDTGKSGASIGEATISAGQTSVVVETTAVTDKSRVFVTATTSTGGQALVVIEKTAGESFKVILNAPLTTEVKFDWWVVN